MNKNHFQLFFLSSSDSTIFFWSEKKTHFGIFFACHNYNNWSSSNLVHNFYIKNKRTLFFLIQGGGWNSDWVNKHRLFFSFSFLLTRNKVCLFSPSYLRIFPGFPSYYSVLPSFFPATRVAGKFDPPFERRKAGRPDRGSDEAASVREKKALPPKLPPHAASPPFLSDKGANAQLN